MHAGVCMCLCAYFYSIFSEVLIHLPVITMRMDEFSGVLFAFLDGSENSIDNNRLAGESVDILLNVYL